MARYSLSGIVDRVSTPSLPPPPDTEDLRGLARGLRLLFEIGAQMLTEDAEPSELALKVTGHLGCELNDVLSVAERFPVWEHVNIQRGVEAYLAARGSAAEWFGTPGAGFRPHENLLSLIGSPESGRFMMGGPVAGRVAGRAAIRAAGTGAASFGASLRRASATGRPTSWCARCGHSIPTRNRPPGRCTRPASRCCSRTPTTPRCSAPGRAARRC